MNSEEYAMSVKLLTFFQKFNADVIIDNVKLGAYDDANTGARGNIYKRLIVDIILPPPHNILMLESDVMVPAITKYINKNDQAVFNIIPNVWHFSFYQVIDGKCYAIGDFFQEIKKI